MSSFSVDLIPHIDHLISTHNISSDALLRLSQKQPITWTNSDVHECLDELSALLISHPGAVLCSCRPMLIEVVARCLSNAGSSAELSEILPQLALSCVTILSESPPCVLELVLSFFRHTLDLFQCASGHPLAVAKSAHLLLSHSERFAHVWRWPDAFALLEHQDAEVRWHAAMALALLGNMGDEQRRQFAPLQSAELRVASLAPPRSSLCPSSPSLPAEPPQQGLGSFVTPAHLTDSVCDVCGVLLPRRRSVDAATAGGASGDSTPFVGTPTVVQNLRAIALGLAQRRGVLCSGVTGSGKSALLAELARLTGNTDMVAVHLGDQTDAKVLLGSYVCTEIPGEFRWQPGILTQAVAQGRWLLIEDIDLAPLDVVSVLVPLLESRRLFIPGRGEVLEAADNFQLFATQNFTTRSSRAAQTMTILSGLCVTIAVDALSPEELRQVLARMFPRLVGYTSAFVDAFYRATRSDPSLEWAVRSLSTRDVIKWCRRVDTLYQLNSAKPITNAATRLVFGEAVECFTGKLADAKSRRQLINAFGAALGLMGDQVEQYVEHRTPQLENSADNAVLQVGRARLTKAEDESRLLGGASASGSSSRPFALTRHSLLLLERLCVCIAMDEPALLVSATGVGKTSAVQYLAHTLGHELVVINLNQQSDSSDLLGGFQPVDMQMLCAPLKRHFDTLFPQTFSAAANAQFITQVHEAFEGSKWKRFLKLLQHSIQLLHSRGSPSKRTKNALSQSLAHRWRDFAAQVAHLEAQREQIQHSFAFAFVEGALVDAVKQGKWVLLDEVNLAGADMLESLSGLLEGSSLWLAERGDSEAIPRHSQFRLFACMNPATDVGRKELPPGLRNRFTEMYVDECLSEADLRIICSAYLPQSRFAGHIERAVAFYLCARQMVGQLRDGAGMRPHYSLRSLSRALEYCASVMQTYGVDRALHEGVCMTFLTMLDAPSQAAMEKVIRSMVPAGTQAYGNSPGDSFLRFHHFWVECGSEPKRDMSHYILTRSIKKHLRDIARIVVTRKYPILLQGPTSSGKTSMVEYLAGVTGHKFVRINNHEHTDISEYLGSYTANTNGKLVFKEGALVEAVRNGYWVVLDELNLAPSEVLESLNRLLDDNRELFIPETQQVIRPHPHFVLFATQNPPGLYGGRKALSPAFRNRFLELQFDDIPDTELQTILEQRCSLAPSYSQCLVAVMRDLQRRRQESAVFAGKDGFITLRDLFKWASREPVGYQQLAEEGFMLLGERLRRPEEKKVIAEVLEAHLKGVKVDVDTMYESCEAIGDRVVWTSAMKRLCKIPRIVYYFASEPISPHHDNSDTLVSRCVQFKEPVLLVGDTGCGKTTVCQLLAENSGKSLSVLNLHEHTETADFLGGLRPTRGRAAITRDVFVIVREFMGALQPGEAGSHVIDDSMDAAAVLRLYRGIARKLSEASAERLAPFMARVVDIGKQYETLFQWYDGPLVEAMKNGDYFLMDEVSLAEDAVLERLNSVLEPARTLVLTENAGASGELRAHPEFRIFATMNPGGDFGKRELSPALRNRFTEIWVPAVVSEHDLRAILSSCCTEQLTAAMVEFRGVFGHPALLGLRDLLSWASFARTTRDWMTPRDAFSHGVHLVLLDGLELVTAYSAEHCQQLRQQAVALCHQLLPETPESSGAVERDTTGMWGAAPFYIGVGPEEPAASSLGYSLMAPTTAINTQRVLRALQLDKGILLEGTPGQGKTSLVVALARASGHRVVRINLSEQTDMMDLVGADLPVEGGSAGDFEWRNGVFLEALVAGHWVLLDELNLASQSVLEGLNSVLDHRRSLFVPELNQTFQCPASFRIFGCQNPTADGGGRKGLPRSFLNRFTKVHIGKLSPDDMHFIASAKHPEIPRDTLTRMIRFNSELYQLTMVQCAFGARGRPWEFNLRDVFRWCQVGAPNWSLVYEQRMRTPEDRAAIRRLHASVFGGAEEHRERRVPPGWSLTRTSLRVGCATLPRRQGLHSESITRDPLQVPRALLASLETCAKAVQLGWMSVIVGDSGSGKTSLVRTLAALTGNQLHEFAMNTSVDTTELLGSFEQLDMSHHKTLFWEALEQRVMKRVRRLMLEGSSAEASSLLASLRQCRVGGAGESRTEAFSAEHERLIRALLGTLGHEMEELTRQLEGIQRHQSAAFEWRDGLLIHAIQRGHWVLIDNVNFCNPAVLDRLNPLMEPNGRLLVNERGLVDGAHVELVPHPDFRLFLAMDPRNGEISRAMRNRGLEVVLLRNEYSADDCARLTRSLGMDGQERLLAGMLAFHESRDRGSSTMRHLHHWASLAREMSSRGLPWRDAVLSAMQQVYWRQRDSNALAFSACLPESQPEVAEQPSALLPQVFDLCRDSEASRVVADMSLLASLELLLRRCSSEDAELRRVMLGNQADWPQALFEHLEAKRATRFQVLDEREWDADCGDPLMHFAPLLVRLFVQRQPMPDASSIARSAQFHRGALSDKALLHPAETVIFPMLQALRQLCLDLCSHWDPEQLSEVWELRCSMWNSCCGVSAPPASSLWVYWRKCFKLLQGIASAVDVSPEFRAIVEKTEQLLQSGELGLQSPLLKRSTGLVLRSMTQHKLMRRISDLEFAGALVAMKRLIAKVGAGIVALSFNSDTEGELETQLSLALSHLSERASESGVVRIDEELALYLSLRQQHSLQDLASGSSFVDFGMQFSSRNLTDYIPYVVAQFQPELLLACERSAAFTWHSLVGPDGTAIFRDTVSTLVKRQVTAASHVPVSQMAQKARHMSLLAGLLCAHTEQSSLLDSQRRRLSRAYRHLFAVYCADEAFLSRLTAAVSSLAISAHLVDELASLESTDRQWLHVLAHTLVPMLGCLAECHRDSETRVGVLWVALGCASFHLLRPQLPYDPAARHAFLLAHLSRVHEERDRLMHVRRSMETQLNGRSESLLLSVEAKQISRLVAEIARVSKKLFERPDETSFALLYEQITKFGQSVANEQSLVKAVRAAISGDGSAQMQQYSDACSKFTFQLQCDFEHFQDVAQPVSLAAQRILFGFSLLEGNRDHGDLSPRAALQWIGAKNPESAFRQMLTDMEQTPRVLRALLDRAEYLATRPGGLQSLQTVAAIGDLLRSVARSWLVLSERRKEERRKREASIRYKEVEPETDEQAEERVYKQIFPDVANPLEDLDVELQEYMGEGDEPPVSSAAVLVSQAVAPVVSDQQYLLQVCRIHSRLFEDSAEGDDQSALQKACATCYASLQPEEGWSFDDVHVPPEWHLFSVASTRRALEHPLDPGKMLTKRLAQVASEFSLFSGLEVPLKYNRRIFDIYRDPNVNEAKLVIEPVAVLAERVSELLAQWPEHEVLIMLDVCCRRVLELPHTHSLIAFVAALEFLLKQCQKWEDVAAKHVTLEPHLSKIGLLILRWRKLELLSWSQILVSRVHTYEQKSLTWWFQLHGVLEGGQVEQTLELLITFVESSTLGDFRVRLGLLKSFSRNIAKEIEAGVLHKTHERARCGSCVENVYRYYSQYVVKHESEWRSLTAELDKSIRDFLKLARWESSSYIRLKDSAEKSRRKVNKFIKKMDEILRIPVGHTLFTIAGSSSLVMAPSEPMDVDDDESVIGEDVPAIPADQLISIGLASDSRVGRAADLCKRMRNLIHSHSGHLDEASLSLGETTDEIIQTMEQMQKSGTTKSVKKLALSRWLKAMPDLGMSWKEGDVDQRQKDLKHMLQRDALDTSLNPILVECESYFFRCLARIKNVRLLAANASSDLSRGEQQKLMGYVEHGVHMCAVQRQVMQELSECIQLLGAASSDFASVASGVWTATPAVSQRVRVLLESLAEALDFQCLLDTADVATIRANMQRRRAVLSSCRPEERVCCHEALALSLLREAQEEARVLLSRSDCCEPLRQAAARLASADIRRSALHQEAKQEEQQLEFPVAAEALVSRLLVCVQQAVALESPAPASHVQQVCILARSFLSELSLRSLASSCHTALLLVCRGGPDSSSAPLLAAQLAALTAQLAASAGAVMRRLAGWQRALAKWSYVTLGVVSSLFEQGFCDTEDDDGKGNGQMTFEDDVEGTGMGEGEGKKDVTDQIEDPEEQLMGTRDEKKEEPQRDVEEEENGAEMEQDFEGDIYDFDQQPGEQEEEEEDDDAADDEEPEMDDQMGDFEPEENDVVDERLWDEDDDDDEEEFDREGGDDIQQEEGMELELAPKLGEDKPEDAEPEGDADEDLEDAGDQMEEPPEGEQPEVTDNTADLQDDEVFDVPEQMEISSDEEGDQNDEAPEGDEEPEDPLGEDEDGPDQNDEDAKMEGADDDVALEEKPDDVLGDEDIAGVQKFEQQEQQEENQQDQAAYGVRDMGSNDQKMQEEDAEEEQEQGTLGPQTESGGATQGEASEQRDAAERDADSRQPKPMDANPFRSLADAAQQWLEQIDALDKDQQEDPPVDQGNNGTADQYEFDAEAEEQAMAPATAEQMQQQQRLEKEREEEEEEEEREQLEPQEKKLKAEETPEHQQSNLQGTPFEEKAPEEEEALPLQEEEDGQVELGEEQGKAEMMDVEQPDDPWGGKFEAEGEEVQELLGDEKFARRTLAREDIEELRLDLQNRIAAGNVSVDAEKQWREFLAITDALSRQLCEQLRLLLTPTRATHLVGDYRTGKRINMKRVIPYIASQFKKDKIWLRRRKPSKRNYQIMLAIDDSRSMMDNNKGQLALEALATLSSALSMLEVGEFAVARFGNDVALVHDFGQPWTDRSGAEALQSFSFAQTETNVQELLSTTLQMMEMQRREGGTRDYDENVQLLFVVSDGLLGARGNNLVELISEAAEKRILVVFLLIDNQGDGQSSVLDIQSIARSAKGKLVRTNYMDQFPFPYYLILKDINGLPMTLSDALRQWFELYQ